MRLLVVYYSEKLFSNNSWTNLVKWKVASSSVAEGRSAFLTNRISSIDDNSGRLLERSLRETIIIIIIIIIVNPH